MGGVFSFLSFTFGVVKIPRDIELSEAFGDKLRELRATQNLSQEDLANLLGTSPSQIGRVERGQTNPTLSTMAALYKVFGIAINDLLELKMRNS